MTARLWHRSDGPDGAPAVVLANSLGTTGAMWAAVGARLAKDFRVITFDTRGHGDSECPAPPWTIDDLGHDVVAMLDELHLDRVSFVGVSLGGMVGMWLASHAPQRVDRLTLMCTSAGLAAPQYWRDRATKVRHVGMTAIVDAVVERWFTPDFASQHPDVVNDFKVMLASSPPDGYAACCEAIGELDLRDELSRIAAPTLVIAGADDLAIPPQHGVDIAAAVAGASFVSVEHAAHLANVEQPDVVSKLILDHLLA